MNMTIFPSQPHGTVVVPPSKSMAHRMLICAALAHGESVVSGVDLSEDIAATVDCLRALGAEITVNGSAVTVRGCFPVTRGVLPCRESGSTLRFLIPLCLLGGGGVLQGSPRLMERPLSVYEELFSLCRTEKGVTVSGELTAGTYRVAGNVSSQFLTGLLFALPLLKGDSRIESTTPLESESYLHLTLSALRLFGVEVTREDERTFLIKGNQAYRPCAVTVEGDESNAAFFGALAGMGAPVTLTGRRPETLQGDRVWETYFERMAQGFCTCSVKDCPDLAPILTVFACLHHGVRLTHTARLRMKESDRGAAMAEELKKFGASVTLSEDEIVVDPTPLHSPTEPLWGHNDHRVVMSLAVLCTKYGGTIRGAEAVRKSYPAFFEALKRLHVRMEGEFSS